MLKASTTAFDPSAQWRASVIEAVRAATGRFIALTQDAPEHRTVRATPPWTVHDVAAHVAGDVPRLLAGVRGKPEPGIDRAAVVALNDRAVASAREVPLPALLERISSDVGELVSTVRDFGDAQPNVPFDGGTAIRADIMLAVLLGELLVHGHDLASELGRPWPLIASEVSLVLDGGAAVLPGWLTPRARGHHATYETRVRGSRNRLRLRLEDGMVRFARSDERSDVVISGSPEALLLTSYGRRSPIRYALKGQLAVWGRRPWLGLTLPGKINQP